MQNCIAKKDELQSVVELLRGSTNSNFLNTPNETTSLINRQLLAYTTYSPEPPKYPTITKY